MVQNMLCAHITILKVRPLILPAVAAAVGMFEGGTFGAIFGLFLGFFGDMSFAENTVLFMVLMALIGFTSGFASDFIINRSFLPYMASAFVALLFTALIQMIRPWISNASAGQVLLTGLLQTLWSLPFAAGFYPLTRWLSHKLSGPSEKKDR